MERYEGDSRRIPLLELVDPDSGIGAPDDPMDLPDAPDAVKDDLRARLIARALRDGCREAVLKRQDLQPLGLQPESSSCTNGCEIGFQIAAKDRADLDEGNYLIRPVHGLATDGTYKTVHRFAEALDIDAGALQESSDADPNAPLPVELVFTPHDQHYAGLLQVPASGYAVAGRRERLPAGVVRIEPRDILIGLEGTRFVAYSRTLKRRLLIKESYMLQVTYFGPPHMRLLSMIGKQDHVLPRLWSWGFAAQMPFTPRVRYERLVLAPAVWTLTREELFAHKDDLNRFLQHWRESWNVPRWVYLVERDLEPAFGSRLARIG